jgi:1,2-diacylglycerol 3-alpha-glucosyltransferase
MNIGIVTQWFDCGAGYVSRAYVETLTLKHKVFVFSRERGKRTKNTIWDLPFVTYGASHPCLTGVYPSELTSWIKNKKLDAVIFNEQRHWEGVIVAKTTGVLVGAYIDYYTVRSIPQFGLYDFLICNTRRHLSVFSWHPGVCHCPWGTDTSVFSPNQPVRDHSQPLRFFISSGVDGQNAALDRQMDRRGTGSALRAFQKVDGDCRLIIHSQSLLCRCPEEWQATIAADHRIEFKEGTVAPPGLYALGDVYVYPSRLDGIGLTLPEALSCGLAALTTDNAPMNEFVHEGLNGRLLRVTKHYARDDGYYWPMSIVDEEYLARVMQELVDDREQAARLGRHARAMAVELLDWSKNSHFLNDWIPSCKKLIAPSAIEDHPLAGAARDLDRNKAPSPVQQIYAGLKRLRHQLANAPTKVF